MEGDARPKLLRRGCLPAAGGSQDGRRCAGDMIGGALPLRNPEGAAEGTQAASRCIAAIPSWPADELHRRVCACSMERSQQAAGPISTQDHGTYCSGQNIAEQFAPPTNNWLFPTY